MEFLSALWMPILVSAVLVFIASFFTHMVLPHHKSEFGKASDESAVMGAIAGEAPGRYMFPYPSDMKDINSPEFMERMRQGPCGLFVRYPGPVNMGQNLMLTFLFYILVGIFVAYIGWHSIDPGSEYLFRFRICGAVAFAAHGLGWMSFFIWFRYGKFWPNFFDSLAYALITAGTFAWLWPKA